MIRYVNYFILFFEIKKYFLNQKNKTNNKQNKKKEQIKKEKYINK